MYPVIEILIKGTSAIRVSVIHKMSSLREDKRTIRKVLQDVYVTKNESFSLILIT